MTVRFRTTSRLRLCAAGAIAALLLTACGQSDDGLDDAAEAKDAQANDAFPVQVETKFGDITVVKPYDLTFARYEALVLLTFSKGGELPMSKIGERLMVHPTSVTNTVDRLVRSGLVTKRPNPNDGRGILASITGQGRSVCDRATQDLMAMEFGLTSYDDEECAEIFAMLRPLRVAVGDFSD